MTPQTINAYYHPSLNEIVFPAAILQPPFFNPAADDAVNYGAMGAIVGHEMTHGFDDQGRKYNADGNMVDWWTETDGTEYEQRVQVMGDQVLLYTLYYTRYTHQYTRAGDGRPSITIHTVLYTLYSPLYTCR
jgi:predicted metalloendopeptidase